MADTPVAVKKAASAPARGPSPDPWQFFRSEMDRLFDRFGFGAPALRRLFDVEPMTRFDTAFGIAMPAVDVTEDDKSYKLTAELPGMSEKDIDVTVSGDAIILKGEKRQEREEKDKNRYLSERVFGSFQRSFEIPEGVDRDHIAAEFAKGVLTLTLPKTGEAQKQQKKIEVKAS